MHTHTHTVGVVEHVYGSGVVGRSDGVAGEVQFNSPQGLVWHDRALYVADTENHAIRKVVCLGGGGGVRVRMGQPFKVVVVFLD